MSAEKDREPVSEVSSHVTMRAGAVFLSYASEDAAAAERIAAALRNAGLEVWFDRTELRGGDAWDQKIRQQIKACALFIPVISRHAHNRIEGYFRLEWKLAVDRSHLIAPDQPFLLPVVTDDTPQSDERIPDRFRELQWTRLPGGQTTPGFIERVQRLLLPEAPTAATSAKLSSDFATAESLRKADPSAWWWYKPALWAIGALLAVALAYLVMDRVWLSKRTSATANSAAPSVTAAEKSIAVLPFVDLSEKHDQEYFADGMAEEILDLLAQIPGLRVIGRTSSFQFKGNNSDLRKIGATLGAGYLLEGSVRKSGTTVKVTVQLIDARDGSHRWAQTYEREVVDAMLLQKQIATAVARELQVSVSDYFGPSSETKSSEAHDMYLRGLRDVDMGDRDSELRAIAEMSKAVELDPSYVNALIGLADAYDVAATSEVTPPIESYRLARLANDKALTLDRNNADAYAMRAFIRINTWDWSGAEQDIHKSLSVRKTNGAMQAEARLAQVRGDLAKAEELLRNVLAIDPLDTESLSVLAGVIYPAMGRFTDADRLYAKMRDINPNALYINAGASFSALMQGNHELALRLAEKESDAAARESTLAIVYNATGKPGMSKLAIDRLLRVPGPTDYWIATAYAYIGKKDLAFQYLERAYEHHTPDLLFLKIDPLLASVRTDQRYKALLRKMNLE